MRSYKLGPESIPAVTPPMQAEPDVNEVSQKQMINSQTRKIARLEREIIERDVEIASVLKRVDVLSQWRKAHSSGKCKAIKQVATLSDKLHKAEDEIEMLRATASASQDAPDTPELAQRILLRYSKSGWKTHKFILTLTADANSLMAKHEGEAIGQASRPAQRLQKPAPQMLVWLYQQPQLTQPQYQLIPIVGQPQYQPAHNVFDHYQKGRHEQPRQREHEQPR